MIMKRIIVVAGLIAFSQAASAHTGLLPTDGFSHGFQHPFLGLDHFLAMLGLGLWASSQSRKLAGQAIGVFLLFMTAGALFGLSGFGFAYVETAILVSLVSVGIALSLGTIRLVPTRRVGIHAARAAGCFSTQRVETVFPRSAWERGIILMSISIFAAIHGLAHGSEMPVAALAYAYIAGIVSGTAVLHCSGLALGLLARRVNATGLIRIYGTMTGMIGAWLLFTA
jgi:urease accessory protein